MDLPIFIEGMIGPGKTMRMSEPVEKPWLAQISLYLEHRNNSIDQNISNVVHSVKSFYLLPIFLLVFQQTQL